MGRIMGIYFAQSEKNLIKIMPKMKNGTGLQKKNQKTEYPLIGCVFVPHKVTFVTCEFFFSCSEKFSLKMEL